jgi:hypothetical protein
MVRCCRSAFIRMGCSRCHVDLRRRDRACPASATTINRVMRRRLKRAVPISTAAVPHTTVYVIGFQRARQASAWPRFTYDRLLLACALVIAASCLVGGTSITRNCGQVKRVAHECARMRAAEFGAEAHARAPDPAVNLALASRNGPSAPRRKVAGL